MSYLDDYKSRINVSGTTIGNSQFNATANFLESTFADSPFYRVATKLDNSTIELRLADVNTVTRSADISPIQFTIKFAFLKPNISINIGEIIQINSDFWIVADFTLEQPLYPKAKIQHCNYILPIQTGETSVYKGIDDFGKAVYQKQPTYTNLHCYVKDYLASVSLNQPINQVVGRIYITLQYNSTSMLVKENDIYTLYGKQYKITASNYSNSINGVGCITFIADRVVV